MGVAGAGSQAVASDASTAFHNPAGMTRIKGKEFMLTGGLLYADIKFDPAQDTPISGGNGGSAGGVAPMLGNYYVRSLTDRLKLGANLISISNAVLEYDRDWAGRYINTEVSVMTLTFNPTIAYRVTDWLSIGGGLQIMYADMEWIAAFPPPNGTGEVKADGDDVAYGYDLGVMIELSQQTRFGVIYQAEIEIDFSGDVEINPLGAQAGIDTDFTLAQFIRFGFYHEINDQIALLGSVGWEDWSTLDNIVLSTSKGSQKIPTNWDDTWKFSGGVHYRPTKLWLFQAGVAYDTSPVDAVDRTPDLPLDRQFRYALGMQYEWSESLSLGGQFVYADYGDAEIRNDLLKGEYDKNDIFFLAMNANWKF
jgi:long-chain fatty acid transport protein